jgi:drug/metabolite transporter (DMT)-like permease
MFIQTTDPARAIRLAVVQALIAAVLFGVSAPLGKTLVGHIDPWLFAGLLYLGSGLGLGLALVVRNGRQRDSYRLRLNRRQTGWFGIAIVCGGLIAPVLLAVGLSGLPAASASLLLNTEGVFTVLIAWVVMREHTHLRLIIGTILIIIGSVLLSWQGWSAGDSWWAFAAVVGACLCWGIDNACMRPVSEGDPVALAATKGLIAGSVNIAIALGRGAEVPSVGLCACALLVGLFGYGISLVCFLRALRVLGTARTGAYFAAAPFIGAVAALLTGEPWTWALIGAGLLMAIGVWLHASETHDHLHAHSALVHDHEHRHDLHHKHTHGPDDPPGEPHRHAHHHAPLSHEHPHTPDLHHRHDH